MKKLPAILVLAGLLLSCSDKKEGEIVVNPFIKTVWMAYSQVDEGYYALEFTSEEEVFHSFIDPNGIRTFYIWIGRYAYNKEDQEIICELSYIDDRYPPQKSQKLMVDFNGLTISIAGDLYRKRFAKQ